MQVGTLILVGLCCGRWCRTPLCGMTEKKARTEAPGPLTVTKSDFGTLNDGRVVHRYDLSNGSMTVSLVE